MSNIEVMRKRLGPVTAYKYAVSKGFTGTEEEFAALMASYATVAEEAEAAKDDAVIAKTAAEAAQAAAEAAAEQAEGAIEVDDTLSVKGRAADAKKTGDKIAGLKEDLNVVKDATGYITGTDIITLTKEYFIKTNTSPVNLTPQENASFNNGGYALVPCSSGDEFEISGTGGVSGRLWCFIKSDNTIISNAGLNVVGQGLKIVAPEGAVYLIINSTTNGVSYRHNRPVEVDLDNVKFGNPDVRNTTFYQGTGWSNANGVYTCNYSGSSKSWFNYGIDVNSLIENTVVVNADIAIQTGSEFFVGVFGTKTSGSVFVAYAQIIDSNSSIESVIDLNYYAIYQDLDLSKPLAVGIGTNNSPCQGTISNFFVTTPKYALDGKKTFYQNISDMVKSISANSDAINVLNSDKYLISPNGTKYRLAVADDGTLIARPIIPNKTLFIGNSLLLGNGLFGMCATDIDKDYYYYVTQAISAKNANAICSRIWGREFEQCTSVADAESWMTNTLLPNLSNDIDLVVIQLGDNVANATMKDVFETTCSELITFIKSHIAGVTVAWAGAYFTSDRVQSIISNACSQNGITMIDFATIPHEGAGIGTVINYGTLGTRQYEINSYVDDSSNKIVTVTFMVGGATYTASVPYESFSYANGIISIYGTYGYAKTSAVGSHPSDETMYNIANLIINALGFN